MNRSMIKRAVSLLICISLAACCFTGCETTPSGKTVSPNRNKQNSIPMPESTEPLISPASGTLPIVEAIKAAEYAVAYPFSEGLAYIRLDYSKTYFIDKSGNIKFTLDEGVTVGGNDSFEARFHNGLFFMNDHLINTSGKSITAEDLDGTALHSTAIDYELLSGGYFVVDKVSSDYAGATYESAIYNTNLELVRPYSTDLYTLFHPDGWAKLSFYDGNVISYDGMYNVYAIETDTITQYDTLPPELETLYYISAAYSPKGLYLGDTLVLDLSALSTLQNVDLVGDLGLATFENEEGHGYFTIMDTEGNFKFDPIAYSSRTNYGDYCKFNGNVILVKTFLDWQSDGTQAYQIKTFDIHGNELGCLNESTASGNQLFIYLGEDAILVDNKNAEQICYYDANLQPLFSTN